MLFVCFFLGSIHEGLLIQQWWRRQPPIYILLTLLWKIQSISKKIALWATRARFWNWKNRRSEKAGKQRWIDHNISDQRNCLPFLWEMLSLSTTVLPAFMFMYTKMKKQSRCERAFLNHPTSNLITPHIFCDYSLACAKVGVVCLRCTWGLFGNIQMRQGWLGFSATQLYIKFHWASALRMWRPSSIPKLYMKAK